MPTIFLLLFVVLCLVLSHNGVYAFGAGNIPSFAYMEGRAFRHGDIEDALAQLIKRGAGAGGLAALTSMISKGSKFNGLDIKRVYFGNWLRDYSQAMDIASLKKMPQQTIINLCMALGFLAHGYATHEFEVTPERLGVYLPVEHIDNPKGYGEGEDPRKYHPKLRPPVDPRELDVDPRTGMKNFIANEQGGWDTSKALVRRTLEQCIHFGRQHRSRGQKQDEYESFRLLGTALHTLEDFTAHSNFCELTLVAMGFNDVFLHVGDHVRVQAPNGRWVAPIVTGTFGSNDFLHSILGEATDHLSQASVTDLNKEIDRARSASATRTQTRGGGPASGSGDDLRDLLFSLPDGAGGDMSRDLEEMERIRAGPATGGKNPDEMSPQELHAVLWQVLTFRDSVVKKISKTIEKIPGLGALIEKIQDSTGIFVFTTLEPFLKPIIKTATAGLQEASGEVINSHDQYEVFNDPRASDPTHSFLSKDHFNLILNEPAGQIAQVIVRNTVGLVTKAWDDNKVNVQQTTEEILQAMFHPDFHNQNSKVQREMLQCMHSWANGLGHRQRQILQRLTKNSVRNHENIRLSGEGGASAAQGTYAQQQGSQVQNTLLGYVNQVPGASAVNSVLGVKPTRPQRDGIGGEGGGGQAASFYGTEATVQTTSYGAPQGGGAGEAASFYGATSVQTNSYAPPQGPPPPSSYSSPLSSSYAPPSGPPPSSYAPPGNPPPSFPGSSPAQPPQTSGYAPSYAPSYTTPVHGSESHRSPSIGMPDALFTGGHAGHYAGPGGGAPSFPAMPSPGPSASPYGSTSPPSFPGSGGYGSSQGGSGYGPPQGPPPGLMTGFPEPGFPGANTERHHHHQQQQQQGPQFPGSSTGGGPPYQGGW